MQITEKQETIKPIIFLDVDGVLNTPMTWGGRREKGMDADKVERLNALVEELDALIVISSAWRHAYTLTELKQFLHARGLSNPERIIDITPTIELSRRGEEIKKWFAENGFADTPFVAIDDQWEDSFDKHIGREHYVLTSIRDGITNHIIMAVREKLKAQGV
jgi:hypothetical protein